MSAHRDKGDTVIFNTTDSELKYLNGQEVNIVEVITTANSDFDAEVLPMFVVEPDMGGTFTAYPDELTGKE